MKKLFKENMKIILSFTFGFLLAAGIGVYAYTISSSDVSYDNSSSGLTSDNVKGALDELYVDSQDAANNKYLLNTDLFADAGFSSVGVLDTPGGGVKTYASKAFDITKMSKINLTGTTYVTCYNTLATIRVGLSKTQTIDDSFVELYTGSVRDYNTYTCTGDNFDGEYDVSSLTGDYHLVIYMNAQGVNSVGIKEITYD